MSNKITRINMILSEEDLKNIKIIQEKTYMGKKLNTSAIRTALKISAEKLIKER